MHSLLRSATLSKGSGFRALLELKVRRFVTYRQPIREFRSVPGPQVFQVENEIAVRWRNKIELRIGSIARTAIVIAPVQMKYRQAVGRKSASGGRKRQEVASPTASRRHASRHRCCAFSECKDPSRIGLSSVSPSVLASPVFLLNLYERFNGPKAPGSARRFASTQHVGEWLSLVEHLVRDQGVGGSNPLSPTNIFNGLQTSAQGHLVLAPVS
jgi:hypothetical protein